MLLPWLLLLPIRAPMLILLLVISIYFGMHWSGQELQVLGMRGIEAHWFWTVETTQAILVVIICTMPDVLLHQISLFMASSRVVSLIVTLLLVITGGLYLLNVSVLSNVLILASAVFLARLDLTRIRIAPRPEVMSIALSILVIVGIWIGRDLSLCSYQIKYLSINQNHQQS
ncbi:hypothetical protein PMYN1_Chma469 (chromatophore) [Paulinella micropora]|uniref:Uncharacterized protein n=1 Tax=Paulinella micropora TaxID=1928728 RepID=A0A1S6YID2_9EUKA|nr:hypothetical protein PFK_519 [Paulinella micropora]BBL86278.1 hypothetical protein PMYN1_Chma469 [Paulinella micropora]